MELTQLRYFQVVAYYEHISRAAEELNISQPALSSMISRLEKELGISLFDRSGRSVVLNHNGQIFLKRVNSILMEVEDSKRELEEIANENESTISLAVSSSQFLKGMQVFMNLHPTYKWHQFVAESRESRSLLERGEVDLAVTSPGIYGDQIQSILLLRDTFKLAVHKDNPLARKKSVRLSELTDARFVMLQKGLPFRTQVDGIFSDLGITPRYIIECDHMLRRELIDANVGVTIASQSASFRHLYNANVRFLDMEDVQHTRDIVLAYRKGHHLNRASRQFAQFLQEKFEACSSVDKKNI